MVVDARDVIGGISWNRDFIGIESIQYVIYWKTDCIDVVIVVSTIWG